MAKEITKSLIVGVGGTGQRIIIALKKRLYQRYGEIPSVIKFLSIDADSINAKDEHFTYEYNGKTFDQKIEIEPGEQFWFGRKNLLEFYEDQESFKKFTPKDFLNYAPEATSGQGAEGIRLIGKMLISTEYNNLRTKIDSIIGNAIKDDVADNLREKGYELDDNRPFLCFMAGSWAGGAGSGIFKDVTDLLHTSTELAKCDLIGFFAMPEFYKEYGNTQNARVNAYSSFRETDHLQDPNVWKKKSVENVETFDGQSINTKRFNSIYIMQNKLENGRKIDTTTMEDATAGAISNMVSVIGERIFTSIVNNHQFRSNMMNGKRRGYSGFGVCEIELDRKKLNEFIINRVILDSLNDYHVNNFQKTEFVGSVDAFIKDNHLDEGVGHEAENVNELIDSLFKLDHNNLKKLFFPELSISDSIVKDLESSKTTFLSELSNRASSIMLEYDEAGIQSKLVERLDELLYRKGGLSRAKNFAQIFMSQLQEMISELNNEINTHDEKIESIENSKLKSLVSQIVENQKGALGFLKNKKTKELIGSYSYIVSSAHGKDTIRNHFLERIRKAKAIEIFKGLLEIVRKYYHEEGNEAIGKIALYQKNIESLISEIALSQRQSSSKITDDIKIDINYFMKKIVSNEEVFEQISENINVDLGSFLKEKQTIVNLKELLYDHILEEGKSKVGTILNKLADQDYCIENLVDDYKDYVLELGDEKIGFEETTFDDFLSTTINSKISMMWQYKNMEFADDEKVVQLPEKIFVIGNYDGKEHYFTHNVIENLGIKNMKTNGVNRAATNDRNRITLHLQENAVPAFKIRDIDAYAREFNERKNSSSSYFFSDKRFEAYSADIFPQENIEKVVNLWSIAFVLGIAFNKAKSYYIKSTKHTRGTDVPCFEEGTSKGRNDRQLAFEFFINSDSFIEEVEAQFDGWLERDKAEVRKRLLEYFHEGIESAGNLGKRYSSASEKEKELLFREKKALVDIGLYELNMSDNDFIKEGLSSDELYNHKQELRMLGLDLN